jgi:tetratricopeptide (TPR) repeat protein
MSGSKDKKRTAFIAIGIVVLLLGALAAGAFIRWAITQFAQAPEISETIQTPANVAQAQNLLLEGKVDEATSFIDQSLADPNTSNEDKQLLYVQLGNAAAEKGDYNAAIDAFLKSFEIQEDYQVAGKLGSYYQQIGNNEKAIEYYKKTIQLNPESNAMREANNNTYEQLIISLGGQL